jgi:hypothetical protein
MTEEHYVLIRYSSCYTNINNMYVICCSKLQRGFALMVPSLAARCCEACIQPAEQTAHQVV